MKTRRKEAGPVSIESSYITDGTDNHRFVSPEMVNYLEGQLFQKPVISSFSLTGLSGTSFEISSSAHSVTGFNHQETNISNIEGNLVLKKGGSTIKSDITPSPSSTSVTLTGESFTLSSNGGSIIYELSGTDKRSQTFKKEVRLSAYTPSFIGGLTTDSISSGDLANLTKVASANLSGSRSITLSSTGYLYFVTISTISGITSGGFEVPITKLSNLSATINGVSVSYNVYRSGQLVAGTYSLVIS